MFHNKIIVAYAKKRAVSVSRFVGIQVRLDELCFIGDRLLTDVVFGNLHGMLTVHTQPLTLEGDNRPAAFFRFIEKKVKLQYAAFMNHIAACTTGPKHVLCSIYDGLSHRAGGTISGSRVACRKGSTDMLCIKYNPKMRRRHQEMSNKHGPPTDKKDSGVCGRDVTTLLHRESPLAPIF